MQCSMIKHLAAYSARNFAKFELIVRSLNIAELILQEILRNYSFLMSLSLKRRVPTGMKSNELNLFSPTRGIVD